MTEERTPASGGPALGYMPGVDGLRAIAVAAVVIYHLGAPWLPGGYLGVDMFLVISGYLITSLLLAERERTGRVDLRRFWLRRARRLLPAVLLMLAVVLAYMLVLHADEVGRLRGEVAAALFYVVNWHFILTDVPYFEQFGRPSVFLHLWSLAIEEQFYLVWPPLLVAGLVVLRRRGAVLAVVVAAAAGSTALAWALYEPFTDPSRIYYGTDTRAVALLVGVAVALVPALAPAALRDRVARSWRVGLGAVGLAGAAGLGVAFATLGDLDPLLYQGGFLLVALASAGIIVAAATPGSWAARAFGIAPLVWIGVRSYGIYLWHWPVIMLTRPEVDVPLGDGPALVALRLGLTVALAALSYRYLEAPFRRHGWAGVRRWLGGRDPGARRPARLAAASMVTAGALALIVAVALIPARQAGIPAIAAAEAAARQADAPVAPTPAEGEPAGEEGGAPILFVGDSVMLGAQATLERSFGPGTVVDARVGRRFPEGADLVRGHLRRLPAASTVVLHLGNNDFIDPRDLEALLVELAPRPRVVLLTVRVPLPWQDAVNEAVRAAPAAHPNVTVIDWHAASAEPGLLVDGAHMNERGNRVYADTIAAGLG